RPFHHYRPTGRESHDDHVRLLFGVCAPVLLKAGTQLIYIVRIVRAAARGYTVDRSEEATMTVAIQPPQFLPSLGYFDLMRKADVFVLLDRARFEEKDSQNRARIKTGRGPAWVTVPVIKGAVAQRIADKMIDN